MKRSSFSYHEKKRLEQKRRLERKLALTRITMLCERLLQSFWPAFCIAGLFLALAMFNIPQAFGSRGHALILGSFALVFLICLLSGFRHFHLPGRNEAKRRIEKHSHILHRPIDTLEDKPIPDVIDNKLNYRIWRLHQERMFEYLSRLHVPLPSPGLVRRDPLALRMAVSIMLVASMFVAGPDWRERIAYAFQPDLTLPAGQKHTLDLWITPPDYTAMAPVFLANGKDNTQHANLPEDSVLKVPAYSVVTARVSGGRKIPILRIGKTDTPFNRLDPQSYEIQSTLDPDHIGNQPVGMRVRHHGRTLGEWQISVSPDRPPVAVIPEIPSEAKRAELKLPFYADDDYGLKRITAHISLSSKLGFKTQIDDIDLSLPLPGLYPKRVESEARFDLTPHPWAGLPVVMTLKAIDGAEQTGVSEPIEFVLPERVFTHPVAKQIIAERKRLSWSPTDARYDVAQELGRIQANREAYGGDIVVYLALRVASLRLAYHDNPDIEVIQKLLWDTALRLEDGDLSLAMRDLRDAKRKLQDALNTPGTTDEEIQKLVDDLEAAMQRYMQALAQELRERMAQGEKMPEIPEHMITENISPNALQELMEKLRNMSESGARDNAQEMLSELENMLDMLDPNNMDGISKEQLQAIKRLDDLQELIYQQQKLLDQTMEQAGHNQTPIPNEQAKQQNQSSIPQEQANNPPGQCTNPTQDGHCEKGGQNTGQHGKQAKQGDSHSPTRQDFLGHAEEQRALRHILGEIMRDVGELMGEVPDQMGRAEEQMRLAEDALRNNTPAQATQHQEQALQELQQGLQQYAQKLQQQMQSVIGFGQGQSGSDPLGRDGRGNWNRSGVKIPDEYEMRRVQEILRELRSRSGDYKRPKAEREYIERLLKRFEYNEK